jgi:N-acetylglucosamine-6-phosphate deacetylase
MRVGVSAALVDGELVPGDVAVDHGHVTAVGVTPAGESGTAVPGFVDLQVNGFAGVDFLHANADGYRRAGAALAATGVTAYQPTFMSSPLASYWPALESAAQVQASGAAGPRVLGVHLEGPFLAAAFAGAHDPAHLLDPDLALADRLCDAGPVTMVTVAPERRGGLDLVRQLVGRGVVVSLGHCDADAATAHAAFDAGARAVTHIHNAQRRWAARDPGVAGVALVRPDVVVQAIVDGAHLAAETVLLAVAAAQGRFAVVSDAIEAGGLQPGRYRAGGRGVDVADGEVRLEDGTLAGSVGTMDQAVRNLVGLGVGLPEAVGAATCVPALLLGRDDLGSLRPGVRADLVVLDDELRVARTLVGGEQLHP